MDAFYEYRITAKRLSALPPVHVRYKISDTETIRYTSSPLRHCPVLVTLIALLQSPGPVEFTCGTTYTRTLYVDSISALPHTWPRLSPPRHRRPLHSATALCTPPWLPLLQPWRCRRLRGPRSGCACPSRCLDFSGGTRPGWYMYRLYGVGRRGAGRCHSHGSAMCSGLGRGISERRHGGAHGWCRSAMVDCGRVASRGR